MLVEDDVNGQTHWFAQNVKRDKKAEAPHHQLMIVSIISSVTNENALPVTDPAHLW